MTQTSKLRFFLTSRASAVQSPSPCAELVAFILTSFAAGGLQFVKVNNYVTCLSKSFLIDRRWFTVRTFQFLCLAFLFFLYYAPAMRELINDWRQNSTFSYGFLVPVIAVFLVQRRWAELKSNSVSPSIWAGVPLAIAVLIAAVGHAMGDSFTVRISMILALGSLVWLMFGRKILNALVFPLFYLSLMIPVPYVLIKDLTFYLRYSDANHAASLVQLLGVPVYREAYFLHIPNMTLEVADVCSGVSSVFALFALGVIYAYFLPLRFSLKCLLVACTFPFAIIANLFRIVLTVVLAYNFGSVVFQSYFHGFSGTFTFVLALMMLIGVGEILKKKFPSPSKRGSLPGRTVAVDQSRSGKALGWGSFALGAAVFSTAVYSSMQFNAGAAVHPVIDLNRVELVDGYKSAGNHLEDDYQDVHAETSLSRVFVADDGGTIDLFVGYRHEQKEGIRLRSPKLYFPDKWNFAWLKPAQLTVDEKTVISGNWMLARKGDSAELVIYWYQIAGRTYAGEFEYRFEQLRRSVIDRRNDGAVIRIATLLRNGESVEKAEERLQTFGADLYPQLVKILPQ